jgi:2-keto-4-pentenoate hydratase/2-oxohepta-3-ene-1,7-dioic acid hydratase in catechol pathway
MGPWIETDVDLESLTTRVRLNSTVVAEFRTNDMVFGVARYISAMTRYLTLYPGDVIWMGADSPTRDMVPGDEIEVEIDGIGVLRNRVIAEPVRG